MIPEVVVVGVDAGASRTRAVAEGQEGLEIARLEGAGALADAREPERAARAVGEVVAGVLGLAGVSGPCAALWAGMAGAGRETVRAGVERALARMALAHRVSVGTDVEAAFENACGDGPGILVVAGTGSVAMGRSDDGRIARVGGWGSLLGDEGSGYAIGLEALRRIVRTADGRAPGTVLLEALTTALGRGGPGELVEWASHASKADIAALAPRVADASRRGDRVAAEILAHAVKDLTGHVETLLAALGPWSEPPGIALAGGLLSAGAPLHGALREALAARGVETSDRAVDPAAGAAALARGLVGT